MQNAMYPDILWKRTRQALLAHPESKIWEGDSCMTFRETACWVEEGAEALRGKIPAPCKCAVLCRSERSAALSLLLCFAMGVTALPLSARYGPAHSEKILRKTEPDLILTDADTGLPLPEIRIDRMDEARPVEPAPEDGYGEAAAILCSSGTSGEPKCAMVTPQGLLANLEGICGYFAEPESSTVWISRPVYHCAVFTGEWLTALFKGMNVRFRGEGFQPLQLAGELERTEERVAMGGTPTLFYGLCRAFRARGKAVPLGAAMISGECMAEPAAALIAEQMAGTHVYHVYGMTEASPRISSLPWQEFRLAPQAVGYPLKGVEIELRGEEGEAIPEEGRQGLIHVRGPNLMKGYYRDQEKTREVLQNGWLCTGDMGYLDAAGRLYVTGRRDDMIIRSGMNIYPAEIEGALLSDSRIREAAAFGEKRPEGTRICVRIRGEITRQEVFELCRARLPGYAWPDRIEILEPLPKNASGKLLRR